MADLNPTEDDWARVEDINHELAVEVINLRAQLRSVRNAAIEECALLAEGFDAACDSPRMKLFVDAGLVVAVYKRDGEIGAAIRALKDEVAGRKPWSN